jgi:hypothetical protein
LHHKIYIITIAWTPKTLSLQSWNDWEHTLIKLHKKIFIITLFCKWHYAYPRAYGEWKGERKNKITWWNNSLTFLNLHERINKSRGHVTQARNCKYQSEFTCNVQFIKRVGQSFYISSRFIFYLKHIRISTVGQPPL